MSLQAYDQFAIFLAIILFVAVAFTFANAFLMVMLERMRETGVVMAIGLRPALVRLAYIIESLITATSGIILALLLGTPVYLWLNHTGIDLGSFATGLNAYGIDATVYPSLDANRVWMSLIVIFLFTTIAVVYPAMKASRTQIVEALRHV
jgi:ABC-type lipoprotein release transport system permease subunit